MKNDRHVFKNSATNKYRQASGTTYTGKVALGLTSSHRHAGQQIGMDFFKSGYATRGQEKDEFKPRPLFVRRD